MYIHKYKTTQTSKKKDTTHTPKSTKQFTDIDRIRGLSIGNQKQTLDKESRKNIIRPTCTGITK